MNLKLILVAIVPTGAAVICLLWAYRRRKVPSSLDQVWKPIPTAHSFHEHLAELNLVKSEYRTNTLPSSNELCESADYADIVEDHNLISNVDGQTASELLHNDGSCKDFVGPSEQIKTSIHRPYEAIEFSSDVGSGVVDVVPTEVVTSCDGIEEQVERFYDLVDETGMGCMNQSNSGTRVNRSGGQDCLSISEEMLEELPKQDVVDEDELIETHPCPSQLMPATENYDKKSQVAAVTKPPVAFRKSICCFREFDQGTSGSLSDQEIGWRSSSIASQDSAVITFDNKVEGDAVFYNDVSFL